MEGALYHVLNRGDYGQDLFSLLTTAEGEHKRIIAALSPEAKLRAASRLFYYSAWELKRAGIRRMHPDWTEDRIAGAVRRSFINARD